MVIAGTGHRPDKLGGYTTEVFNNLVTLAYEWLQEYEPDTVISGMALGWDMALAKAAHMSGIPFIAAIPFKGQELKWSKPYQLLYNLLLEQAKEIVIVSEGGYSPYKMQIRNIWMVDNSSRILALWDGTDGGTANCIYYANSKNKPVYNLYHEYQELIKE